MICASGRKLHVTQGLQRDQKERKRGGNIRLTRRKDGKQIGQKPGPWGGGTSLPAVVEMSRLCTSDAVDEEGVVAPDNNRSMTDKKKRSSESSKFKIASGRNKCRPITSQLLCPHKNKLEQAAVQ